MAANVSDILKADPNNKVVFWVGSQHLNQSENPRYQTAADRLKAQYNTATVKAVYEDERGLSIYPLAEITTGIREPVAISTSKATTLGDLVESPYNQINPQHQRDWDYVIVYPSH